MIEAVHADLVRAGVVVPVEVGGAEERSFLDCDLASLAENRLGDLTDPRDLDAARRADWTARALERRPSSLRSRGKYERCYWLVDDGERVGTVALATETLGRETIDISSFYVLPSQRGRGVGRRAIGKLQTALATHDFGLRLDTNWCWQRAVRFYLGVGLWIYMWKRDLTFWWHAGTPTPRIAVGESTASLSVPVDDGEVVLARARRRGDTLEMDEWIDSPELQKDERLESANWHAGSTLSLAIALQGWPLVRSQEAWEQDRYADAGPPEALAYKIAIWEAWDAKHGWLVKTPRIPGLAYPSWQELETRWAAEVAELGIAPAGDKAAELGIAPAGDKAIE